MKEQMIYVAIDADDVGAKVGNAVLQDDAEGLSSISQNINAGVQVFAQWAEYQGGKIISSGSDEAIVQVPVSSIEELEDIKNKYQESSGFTVSIGIGEKISDSAKALIYAKMNGKNQIVDYTPEMEEAMKQNISGDLQEEQESDQDQLEGGLGDNAEESDFDQEQLDMGKDVEKEHTNDEEIAEEISEDHLTEDPEYYDKLKEMEGKNTKQVEVPADQVDGDYGSQEMAYAQPEHEKEMGEEEEFIHDAKENREDEIDEDNIEADEEVMEEGDVDDSMDEFVESQNPADEDIDLDGTPDQQESHGEINPEIDDIDGDGDVEHEEAMAVDAGEEDEYTDDIEDEPIDEGAIPEEVTEEGEIADSLENQMGMDEEMPMEEGMDEEGEQDHDALKNVIYDSLQSFRQHRDRLEEISQSNPELYQALIYSLQAMIQMAKELGYGDVEQAAVEEEQMMEEEQAVPAEDGSMLSEEDESMDFGGGEEDQEDEEIEQEDEEEDFEKNEKFLSLMTKMNKAIQQLKLAKEEEGNLEDLKEAAKNKLKQKGKKKSSSKMKSSVKKPAFAKKKKKPESKGSSDGSFCAKSHVKMRAAGKDCRANEDKDSPICNARKKFNCRGKNEEKGKIQKNEALIKFLSKKRKK